MSSESIGRRQLLFLVICVEGGLGLLAVLAGWCFNVAFWTALYWEWVAVARGLAGAVPMLILFFACWFWRWAPLTTIRHFCRDVVRPLFQQYTLFELLTVALLAGFAEEAFFRGFVQSLLGGYLEPWPALLLTALAFGAVHPITFSYFVLATLMGIYLGWLYLATDNLLVVMLAHGFYDFMALAMLCRARALT